MDLLYLSIGCEDEEALTFIWKDAQYTFANELNNLFLSLREKEFHFTIPTNEENKAKNLDRLEAYAIRMSKHTKSLLRVVFGEYKKYDGTISLDKKEIKT